MIKIKNINVYNFENAIRGMRNPFESWNNSDSKWYNNYSSYLIGDKDLELALRLVKAGTDHSKFMRQIFVSMDIIAPDYWWKEFSTYKIGTVENSTSLMHKLGTRLLNEEDFSFEDCTDKEWINIQLTHLNKLIIKYQILIDQKQLNKAKLIWREIVQSIPMSYNYLRTISLNYQVLRNMYKSRSCHKLNEWREFCKVIHSLPYSELIIV